MKRGHKLERVTRRQPNSCQEKKNVLVRDRRTTAPEVIPDPAIAVCDWKEGRPAPSLPSQLVEGSLPGYLAEKESLDLSLF